MKYHSTARNTLTSFPGTLILGLALGGCFAGGFSGGLSCTDDSDCAPWSLCTEGYCTGAAQPPLCGNALLEDGEECDDGDMNANGACTAICTLALEEPTLSLDFSQVKKFKFTWDEVLGADYYQILEKRSTEDDFERVGEDAHGTSLALTMPLHRRSSAEYRLRACNTKPEFCVDSSIMTIESNLADAVGYFKAPEATPEARFGETVAISGDGSTLAVTSLRSVAVVPGTDYPSVYIFRNRDGDWSQEAEVRNVSAYGAVSLSHDGNLLAVGSPASEYPQPDSPHGVVRMLRREGTTWFQDDVVKDPNFLEFGFGTRLSLSGDGKTLAVGVPAWFGDTSSVYVFGLSDSSWTQDEHLKQTRVDPDIGTYFGQNVSLSHSGTTLAVAAPDYDSFDSFPEGAAYLYERANGKWSQREEFLHPHDESPFTGGIALSADGTTLAIGTELHVSVLMRRGDNWIWTQSPSPAPSSPYDRFGERMALSSAGSVLAVGAPGESGSAVGINGDPSESDDRDAGAVYVFSYKFGEWSQEAYVKPAHEVWDAHFGESVALSASGDTLAVGAPRESGNASGIGSESDALASYSGAVYLY